ncbi:MAG: radical SAM family heme chaperone HemW [Chromatiaceae bacterium]
MHIPWCVRKCPYCDFNSHAAREPIPEAAYVEALLGDLDRELAELTQGLPHLVSLFIGGGTPSLFSGSAIARLLAGIRQRLPLDPTTEITLEANPGTADAANFTAYRAAGVNRLSLGVQSLSADRLRDLGRIHGPDEARLAFRLARQAGFDNINLDLMYGLPHQGLPQAREDLALALALAPEHISYYQLTLEPNTPFHAIPPPLPDDDLGADMQLQGLELLSVSGFAQYEVSAHARSGRQCRHNLNYWTFGDYIGIGAGAHAKRRDPKTGLTWRQAKPRQPVAYLKALTGPDPLGSRWQLKDEDLVLEFAMNALRLTEGFDRRLFTESTGLDLNRLEAPLASAVKARLLEIRGPWVRPTARGRWFLNDLLGHFMPD